MFRRSSYRKYTERERTHPVPIPVTVCGYDCIEVNATMVSTRRRFGTLKRDHTGSEKVLPPTAHLLVVVFILVSAIAVLMIPKMHESDDRTRIESLTEHPQKIDERSINYSFSISTNGSQHVFYPAPGENSEVELILNNTGDGNDSYLLDIMTDTDLWPHTISHSRSPTVHTNGSLIIVLNVTAPCNLFEYASESVFEIKVSSRNRTEINDNITLIFVLTSIDVDMSVEFQDTSGAKVSTFEMYEENRIFYLEIENRGNIYDRYDITLSGLSEGWNAYFRTGERKLSIELASTGALSVIRELIVMECEKNSTDNCKLVIVVNSTISETILYQPNSRIININIDKLHNTNPMILTSEMKFLSVEPGKTVNIPITAMNLGSSELTFKPHIEAPLPLWMELQDPPSMFSSIESQSSLEYHFTLSIAEDSPANTEVLLDFSGECREAYGKVFDTWVHLEVEQVYNMTAGIDTTSIHMEPGETEQVKLILTNHGNGMEEVDIYPIWNGSFSVNLSNKSVILEPSDSIEIVINLSIDDPNSTLPAEIILSVVSLRYNHIFRINVTGEDVIPVEFVDLTFEEEEPDISYDTSPSQPYQHINFTLKNLGNRDSGPFIVNVEIKNKLDSISQVLLNMREENLGAGDSIFYSIPFKPKEADWKVVVEADSSFEVEESSEINNILTANMDPDPTISDYDHIPTARENSTMIPVYATGGGIVFLVLAISLLYGFGSETFRYSMLGTVVPLYSKLVREDILAHETRERVYRFVKNNPGSHYRSILDELDLKNGTLTYHLSTLEKREFIVSKKDGPYRRFFPHGSRIREKTFIHGLKKEIYEFILLNPGMSQKEIGRMLKRTAPTINYHVNNLFNEGLVEIKRKGRETHCFAVNSHNVQ